MKIMKRQTKHFTKRISFLAFILFINYNNSYSQSFDINQTISDGAQGHTIAFDGLAFLTGDFCSCSFIPPGKVADFFGFQYLRDNDITGMGHTTDFNTVIANNLLYVLDSSQKAKILALAISQVPLINQYAYDRFPLIDAFIRMRDNNMPAGSTGLDKEAIKSYSAQLYKLDGRISIQRAELYANIIKALNPQQKNYLDSVSVLGMGNMPVLPDQINKLPLNNSEFVGAMSIAGDIFSWYVGNVDADVYFCPERQGDFFGGFYIKDAPAIGNHGYSIDTSLTQHGGDNFLAALTPSQALLITELVDTQRTSLLALVQKRTDISNLLRGYLTSNSIDTNAVLNLSEIYGQLDGEISYYYATNFAKVNWTLTQIQRDTLDSLRNLSDYPCVGAYLYADSIGTPNIINTDFLFLNGTGIEETIQNDFGKIFPNPAKNNITIQFSANNNFLQIKLQNTIGQTILQTQSNVINVSEIPNGIYFLDINTEKNHTVKKIIVNH